MKRNGTGSMLFGVFVGLLKLCGQMLWWIWIIMAKRNFLNVRFSNKVTLANRFAKPLNQIPWLPRITDQLVTRDESSRIVEQYETVI